MRLPLSLVGKVIKGKERGRKLGFPTANFILNKQIPDGIYVSQTTIDGHKFKSVTFIGAAKTFGEKDIKAETYIIDYAQDIYGKELQVILLKKLRGNKKFTSSEELIIQIDLDIKQTKEYFQKHSKSS